LHLQQGDVERAVPVLERAFEVCRRWNIRIWLPRISSALGAAQTLAGRPHAALPLLEEAIERAMSTKILVRHIVPMLWLAEAYLAAGRTDDAERLGRHALGLACDHQERGQEAWTRRLLGDVALAATEPALDAADAFYREALALAEARGMRPLAAHCRLGLGLC